MIFTLILYCASRPCIDASVFSLTKVAKASKVARLLQIEVLILSIAAECLVVQSKIACCPNSHPKVALFRTRLHLSLSCLLQDLFP